MSLNEDLLFDEQRDEINKLKESIKELLEALKNLLDDAKYLYKFYPNNFRQTEDKYFQGENELINKYEGI